MKKPRIWYGKACRLWLCQVLDGSEGSLSYYGAGRTPQEAYAEWRRDVANAR